MVIGAGFVAKRTAVGTARMLGCSDSTASYFGNAVKWGVAIATLDVGGILLDSALESGVDSALESSVDTAVESRGLPPDYAVVESAQLASDGGAEAAASAGGTLS